MWISRYWYHDSSLRLPRDPAGAIDLPSISEPDVLRPEANRSGAGGHGWVKCAAGEQISCAWPQLRLLASLSSTKAKIGFDFPVTLPPARSSSVWSEQTGSIMWGSSSRGVNSFHHLLAWDIPPASAPGLKGEQKQKKRAVCLLLWNEPSGFHQNQKSPKTSAPPDPADARREGTPIIAQLRSSRFVYPNRLAWSSLIWALLYLRIFISCPVPASLVQPYSPSTAAIHHSVGAICSLSLPVTSTHQLWKFMTAFGERQTKPVSSNLLKYLLLFYPPDRPACTVHASCSCWYCSVSSRWTANRRSNWICGKTFCQALFHANCRNAASAAGANYSPHT